MDHLCGLLMSLHFRGLLGYLIAMDGGNADFAGANICHGPRPSGSLCSFKFAPANLSNRGFEPIPRGA